MRRYDKLDQLPSGDASDKLTHGCLVVEGGALRGMYCQGVLDSLMMNDINFDCLIGVSSGAMNGVNYLSGQIGRGPYLTLKYRPDSRFIGLRAIIENHGITGFKYMWTRVQESWPLNNKMFNNPGRRFVCVATDCSTGRARYFEKGKDRNFLFGMQAGASIPFGSRPVMLEGRPYLDGGIAVHVPVNWAIKQGYEKIVVIRTRDRDYKASREYSDTLIRALYQRRFPRMSEKLRFNSFIYNKEVDKLNELEHQGRIHMIAPSRSLELTLFCNDLEELADLYYLGLNDMNEKINELKKYLEG
ncbi:MAG: patatin family protein [Clostridiales bacterium]|nr:patatin family protein [Clostridiales bacterium]MBS5877064.1 patatin family protein [Clostridiales bacterium]MDU0939091.1 patatin family protein [Clostridiales bacterium]MDU1041774.1 patatin family protein [Clostridiales bacterium]MDU3489611.1 patatin family protein [Clostridiales bacterium]